jgi:pimeloyl-ACP methyl ester carboxylesterase
MNHDDQSIDVPGGRVFVRRWGNDVAALAPIVLLHDSLGSVEQWRDFPEALATATGRSVIAYDRLGFGRSSSRTTRPSHDFIREEGASTLPALARELGLSRYVLFGHSVGGGMALLAAAQHPEACEAVVSVSAQAFVEERTLAGIRAALVEFAVPAQFDKLRRWHGDKAAWVLDAWSGIWLDPAYAGWSLDADLGAVRCPVLAIHGELDEFGSTAFPRRIVDQVAGPAELLLLAGCGHLPQKERRDEVLGRVAGFLAAM